MHCANKETVMTHNEHSVKDEAFITCDELDYQCTWLDLPIICLVDDLAPDFRRAASREGFVLDFEDGDFIQKLDDVLQKEA